MTAQLTPFADRSFAVGLSFAGEQRAYVQDVALSLIEKGVNVFYDRFHEVDVWGCDLVDTLSDLYSERMGLVVVFVSKEYVAKDFTNVERRAAISKAITTRQKFIMPVHFDDTKLPGLPGIAHLNVADNSAEQLAVKICKALGMSSQIKRNMLLPPQSPDDEGTAVFCHSDHDGRYLIGQDEWAFEIKVSAGGSEHVYFLNDPEGIAGVAIAPSAISISDVRDAAELNYTSRHRLAKEGQIVVLQNGSGFYAAIKLVDVQDSNAQDSVDSVSIEYRILRNGGDDFFWTN